MTVCHRQRKGATGSSFLYARGKAFSKPPPFPPKPPEDSLKVPNNPTRPASFLRQFRPSTAPLPALFAAKRGFFAPNARRTRPRRAPDRPVLPRPARFLRGAPRKKPRLGPKKAPAARPESWRATAREARKRPGVRLLPSLRPPVRRPPPEKASSPPKPRQPSRRPARCHCPPPEGQPARPAKAQPWGKATPTAVVGFPVSPWRSARPKGDQIPGNDR